MIWTHIFRVSRRNIHIIALLMKIFENTRLFRFCQPTFEFGCTHLVHEGSQKQEVNQRTKISQHLLMLRFLDPWCCRLVVPSFPKRSKCNFIKYPFNQGSFISILSRYSPEASVYIRKVFSNKIKFYPISV